MKSPNFVEDANGLRRLEAMSDLTTWGLKSAAESGGTCDGGNKEDENWRRDQQSLEACAFS
jgi:hypothetical protein